MLDGVIHQSQQRTPGVYAHPFVYESLRNDTAVGGGDDARRDRTHHELTRTRERPWNEEQERHHEDARDAGGPAQPAQRIAAGADGEHDPAHPPGDPRAKEKPQRHTRRYGTTNPERAARPTHDEEGHERQ